MCGVKFLGEKQTPELNKKETSHSAGSQALLSVFIPA
jgi:hypothetical protein